ncbi:hypothetical protein tb265_17820 [Gemmatimonadetes bacterium T265]|nr:hypothetical protein tb265_17820 [Gemmatimonadetes bacterium T265]
MSADAAPPAAAEPAPSAGGPKPLPVILAVVAGLALGGGAGAFGVGPALASGITPSVAAAQVKHHAAKSADAEADGGDADGDAAADDEGDGGEKKGGKEGAAASVYTIDNLVLNPAGSGGTRFLLLSIAFEMKDAAALESIKSRDAELRDAILVTLGGKTVEQLSEMTARDSLKAELRAATAKALHTRGVRRVYFPQFVIQ